MYCTFCHGSEIADWVTLNGTRVCMSCASTIHELYMKHIVETTKTHKPLFHEHRKIDHPDIRP